MSRFYKVCLIVIILFLAIIAVRPFVSPQPAIASIRYQYAVAYAGLSTNDMETELNKHAADGWELAAPVFSESHNLILIFRKEVR